MTCACLASSSALGSLKRSVFGPRMVGELREDLRQRLPGVLARGDGGQFRVRMRQEQPDEFLARVPGRTDDGDLFAFIIKKPRRIEPAGRGNFQHD